MWEEGYSFGEKWAELKLAVKHFFIRTVRLVQIICRYDPFRTNASKVRDVKLYVMSLNEETCSSVQVWRTKKDTCRLMFMYSLRIKLIQRLIQRANYFLNCFWYSVTAIGNLVYSAVWKCGISFIVNYKEALNLYVWRSSAYPFPFLSSRSPVENGSFTFINYPSLCVDNLRIKKFDICFIWSAYIMKM